MKKFLKWSGIVFAILLVISLNGCDLLKKHDQQTKTTKLPELILKSLMIFDKPVKNESISVENGITVIEAKDVKAVFDYGSEKDKVIPVVVENGTLNGGINTVQLSVEAVVGKHSAWNVNISVDRMDRELKFNSLKYRVVEAESRSILIDITHGSCTVRNVVTEVVPEDFWAFFEDEDRSVTQIDVIIENGLLNVGKNIVKLFVPEVRGKHKAWHMNLTVIRNGPSDNRLVPVTPPPEGIVGSAVNPEDFRPYLTWNTSIESFQGVFIEGRTVILSPFNMAETETTYKLWKEVYDWATDDMRAEKKYTFANPGRMGGRWHESIQPPPLPEEITELEPVTLISWYDCLVWCNAYTEKIYGSDAECVYRASDSDNSVCRDATSLVSSYIDPYFYKTEAEWEYAARVQADGTLCPLTYMSGAVTHCTGRDNVKFGTYVAVNAWCDKTREVKCRAANALGLYDMSGNVYEFCWDARGYHKAVATGTVINPALNDGDVIIRGGSFNSRHEFTLVGAIKACGNQKGDGDDDAVGFRVCQYR